MPRLAGLLTAWAKGVLILFFSKHMLDKYILKVKIHPMSSSGFHGICKITVMIVPWSQRLSLILYWQILRRESLLKFFLLARSADSCLPSKAIISMVKL